MKRRIILPIEEALRVSFVVDWVPFDDDGKKPDESEPRFTKEGNGVEIGEAMVGQQQETISNNTNQQEEDATVQCSLD